ncbi:MAG: flagellar assembly protein FliW [Spirochaetaceae bacterium]|nr:MAG: flagellar assembly protein FliW [Spirochaetaceae bacterium]
MTDVTIQSKPYGEVTVKEQQLLHFPVGLFGFERMQHYALLDSTAPPFFWLQSLDDPGLAFILVNPYLVVPDYVLDIDPHELTEIGEPAEDDLLVFAVVTIAHDENRVSCNLQGPVMINRKARLGRQAISLDARWSIRHSLLENGQG